MELVTVGNFYSPTEADLLASRLQAAGFDAFVHGAESTLTCAAPLSAGGIRVKVPESQKAEVLEFLASEKLDAT